MISSLFIWKYYFALLDDKILSWHLFSLSMLKNITTLSSHFPHDWEVWFCLNFHSSVVHLSFHSSYISISLALAFHNFIMMYLGMDLFWLMLLRVCWTSWFWAFLGMSDSEIVSNILPLNIPSPNSVFLKLLF